jgi:hypothetical protein
LAAPTPPADWALKHDITYYIPPLQLHLVLAGFVGALVIAASGLTIRRWQLDSMAQIPLSNEIEPATLAVPPERESIGPAERAGLRSDLPDDRDRPGAAAPKVYPGWVWLAGFALAIATVVAGAWSALGTFTREALQDNLQELQDPDHRRLGLHVVFGVSIVVLSLILAGLVRFARRWRVLTGILGAIVLLLIAKQIWLGILITYDGPQGPLLGFVQAPQQTAPQPSPPSGHPDAAPSAAQAQPEPRPAPVPQQPPAPQEPPSAPSATPLPPAPQPQPAEPRSAPHEEIGGP